MYSIEPGTKVTVPAKKHRTTRRVRGTVIRSSPYVPGAYRVYVEPFGRVMDFMAEDVTVLA